MGVSEPGFGGGMSREAMAALSERIDLDALRGYYRATADATIAYMSTFDFDTLDTPFDVESRLALAPEAESHGEWLGAAFRRWRTPRVWIDVFAVVDVALHTEEAEHVLRLLTPGAGHP
jgi:hypothetical protein